jgi:methylated-DNA-[protein]-cysteine S-methyltransferase
MNLETALSTYDAPVRPPQLPETDVSYTSTDTPVGRLVLAATDSGLLACSYQDEAVVLTEIARRVSPRVLRSARRLDRFRRELDSYFAHDLRGFSVPVDLRLASSFGRRVLRAVARLPYGATTTYSEVARSIREPRAARAVGNALADNPVCIVVPCHRIVRHDGTLGGYAGGPAAKRALLELEDAGLSLRR